MTFKSGENGNAALGMVALMGALATAYLIATLQQVTKQSRLTRRETLEAGLAVSTHSFANLVKAVFDANYRRYLAKRSDGWSACTTAPVRGADDFIAILAAPKGGCASVAFTLAPIEQRSVPLGTLVGTRLRLAGGLNGVIMELVIDQINLERNAVVGTLFVETRQTMRQIIDLSRTLNGPIGDSECHMCLTVPGSVCCASVVKITYLDCAGKVMRLAWDKARQAPQGPPEEIPNDAINPKAVSVKNLDTRRTDYLAIRNVLDEATMSGSDYTLFSDGRIATEARIAALDPRLLSVAFADGLWYLLRDDGAILQAARLDDVGTFREIVGLRIPTAQALAMGRGPIFRR